MRRFGRMALAALMLVVYAVIGRLKPPVVFGALYSGALGIANFFVMGLMVQGITDRMAEKRRSEEEIAELTTQMKNRMRLSYNLRMFSLFGLLALGIAAFHFDAVACIIAALFPSAVIRVLQILEARKTRAAEGSEEP